jgi:hypothetical protein
MRIYSPEDTRATAVAIASAGFSVLPLEPGGKAPLGRLARQGFKSSSSDPAQVERWWDQEPEANLGIACAPSGIVVLDIDERNGGEIPSGLPETLTVGTPGGAHFYFHHRDQTWQPSGTLGEGIDVKWAGYVVAPPSQHPSGDLYRTALQAPIAPLPQELEASLAR